jgi:hypothetical protein
VSSNPLTPRGIVFLGKLIVAYLVKNFQACYGIRRFITSFTTAPWRTAIFEKLIAVYLAKKFKAFLDYLVKKLQAFYGTRRFITAFTTARHWSLS